MNGKLSGMSLLGLLLVGSLVSQHALADRFDRDDRGPHYGHDRHWRGDIHRFHEHDVVRWRAGRWHHGRHDGRLGWWWVVGGVWYLYSAPVYPYPDPYQPSVVMVEQPAPVVAAPVYAPPPAPVYAPQPAPVVAPAPAPAQYWYYCEKPAGYYPYVPQCPSAWQKVPATPPR